MLTRLQKDDGFGLVELVMAMLLLSVGILAILAAFTSSSVGIRRASRVATASALADAQMELYRALRYSAIALDSASVSSANGTPAYSSDPAWSSTQVTMTCPTLPTECRASQSVTGADSGTYRVDTYITYQTPASGRQGKLVTVVVREGSGTSWLTRARVSTTFDELTG